MEGGITQEVARVLGLFNPLPTWIAMILCLVIGKFWGSKSK